MAALQAATALGRQAVRAAPKVRAMSSGVSQAEGAKTSLMWRNIGLGGTAICILGIAKEVVAGDEHEHKVKFYPHERIRNKAFPWACGQCDLFDLSCWDKCRNPDAAEEH